MEKILYKKDHIVLFANYADPDFHKHFAKHILISTETFCCFVEQKSYQTSSMIIQSQARHSISTTSGAKMVVFLIDETSSLSKQLNQTYLSNRCAHPLDSTLEIALIHLLNSGASLETIDHFLLSHFNQTETTDSLLDTRIQFVLNYIEETPTLDSNIYDLLSQNICLSKSRFLHLFKQNLGIDLKNYLLLKRLEKTYYFVTTQKMSITDAAILSGFSSPSHFSEACKQHYGISLTDFLKAQLT